MSFIVQFVDVYGYKPSSSTRLYGLVNLGPSDKLQSYNCAFESFLKTQWSLDVTPGLTFTNSTFCPHSVFVCFVCICEQTAIISLYNIDWLVRVTETECLLRGTYWTFIYNSGCVFCVDLRTNSDNFPIQHWLTGLYNRDGVCLLRGTDWVFICNSGCFLCGSKNKQRLFPCTTLTDCFL